MRIFKDFIEAHKEVERELKHNGIVYQTETVQDKYVGDKDEFKTKELECYSFTVRNPDIVSYMAWLGLNQQWISKEFAERIGQKRLNPGESYRERQNIWEEFLHDGKFSYTYSERIGDQVQEVVDLLSRIPSSRHGIINIYDPSIDNKRRDGTVRVPCSMYYMLTIREGKVKMMYNIRSNDFNTHFGYDLVLARMLQEHVASQLGLEAGDFRYQSVSLHAFYRDNKEIF